MYLKHKDKMHKAHKPVTNNNHVAPSDAPTPSQQIAGMLGTTDPLKQVQAVQQLLAIAGAPPFAVTMIVDSLSGRVMDISSTAQLEATQIMQVIAAGQQWVSERINEAKQKKAQQETTTQATQ